MANRRQDVLHRIKRGSEFYWNLPIELRDDAEIALAAIARKKGCPWSFRSLARHIPFRLRGNKAFVLAAIKVTVLFLKYASDELKADREIVMAAIQKNARRALQSASAELQADRDIVKAAVKRYPMALEYASEELRGDREIVVVVVQRDGTALQYASEELRGDREIAMAAVQQAGWALQYASEELRGDREIVMVAVQRNGTALEYASEELRGDREIAMAAVQQAGWALEYASEELRGDREIVMVAVQRDGTALQSASRELRGHRDIVMAAVRRAGWALQHASRELCGDPEIVMAAVRQDGSSFEYASRELRSDREFVVAALDIAEQVNNVNYQGMVLYVSNNLRNEPVVAGAKIRAGRKLWRGSEIMGRLGNALLAVRALSEADFDNIVDQASVVEFSRWWERCVWHKIWLALQLEPPGMQGTGRSLVKLSGLPLELRQAKELRRCAPVIGAVLSSFPNRDWRDLASYPTFG